MEQWLVVEVQKLDANPEIEQGIFSLAITWIQTLVAQGVGEEEARERVALYLHKLCTALEEYENQEKVTTRIYIIGYRG